jgi:L-cysteine desulfidase
MNSVGYAWEIGHNITSQLEVFIDAIYSKRKKIKKSLKTNKKNKMTLNRSCKDIFFILRDLKIIKNQKIWQGS